MKQYGGFEGNAQTLRILAKLKKKVTRNENYCPFISHEDQRLGLNLTYRTLAAILKYDKKIPCVRNQNEKTVKGYYITEESLVKNIKAKIVNSNFDGELKTIECQLMDLADDIAYSTYDLEDAFKAEFANPLDMLVADPEFTEELKNEVNRGLENYIDPEAGVILEVDNAEVIGCLYLYFNDLLSSDESLERPAYALKAYEKSKLLRDNGYLRTQHTSSIVSDFIGKIKVKENEELPLMSKVWIEGDAKKRIEVLKRFSYLWIIRSPRLKVAEYRGQDIVSEIFNALIDHNKKGFRLLPKDFQLLYHGVRTRTEKFRVICDFIAGMTDRYAVEFYSRLKSDSPTTIFKPF